MTRFANTAAHFPNYPLADLPAIPEGFEDRSWANDMCPSFFDPAIGVELWVDFPKPDDREFPELDRFCIYLTVIGAEGERKSDIPALACEEWAEAEAFIASLKAPQK